MKKNIHRRSRLNDQKKPPVEESRVKRNKYDRNDNLPDRVVEFVLSCEIDDMANLTVKNIAEHFDLTPSYLSRRFTQEKKMTLGEHIMQMKIYRASLLLLTSGSDELTIARLAKKMGFCTTGYFIAVFKKLFGIAPGKYRECVKGKNIL